MRSNNSYFTMCPECDTHISLTLAAKLQAGRIGTSCICSRCEHTWICIQEWILTETVPAPMQSHQEPMYQPQTPVPAPHFQHQSVGNPNGATPSQVGVASHQLSNNHTPHLPPFQPSTFGHSQQTPPVQHPMNPQPVATPEPVSPINAAEHPAVSDPVLPPTNSVPKPHWLNQATPTNQQTVDQNRFDTQGRY